MIPHNYMRTPRLMQVSVVWQMACLTSYEVGREANVELSLVAPMRNCVGYLRPISASLLGSYNASLSMCYFVVCYSLAGILLL